VIVNSNDLKNMFDTQRRNEKDFDLLKTRQKKQQ